MKERLYKKFSIGLNLNEKYDDILDFMNKYQDYLYSIYFSLPLGTRFYSRNELTKEYGSWGAEDKLFRIIRSFPLYGIRSEVAINIYGLKTEDIELAINYMRKKELYPDEIVCLNEYGAQLKTAFPKSELKYSFNNSEKALNIFDTLVVGKGYLRNKTARHQIIDEGKGLVLLLNNGCSFDCHYPCGDSEFCGTILEKNLTNNSLDYIYALQSFFPSEIDRLFAEDDYADLYRFKLSNRPLGLKFSMRAMDSYCALTFKSEVDYIKEDPSNYGLYCVMGELYKRRNDFSLDAISRLKQDLSV